ncbi:hypothetical protein BOX37_13535 [Nocardia mangyaensis]|uniref:Transposase n=1 Tax=Nocardia mangyaensis TaxID=2213200 RepID=A0A1J0VS69_9NOCA|nr:hypothetical protein BOX37_13535 [Nocardia mangyaensis]
MIEEIEFWRRERKWSASRIAFEINETGVQVSRRTVTRIIDCLGLNRRRFIDPNGDANRTSRRILAKRPGHLVNRPAIRDINESNSATT